MYIQIFFSFTIYICRRNKLDDNIQLTRQIPFDPNQPSTSSGLESFGDKSQSRSPSNASSSLGSGDRNCSNRYFRKSRKYRSSSSDSSDESISRKSRKRINNKNNSENSNNNKSKKKSNNKQSGGSSRKNETRNNSRKSGKSKNVSSKETLLREVRIIECNENGEKEETVTHVRVASITLRKRRRTKRRKVFNLVYIHFMYINKIKTILIKVSFYKIFNIYCIKSKL